MDDFTNEHRPAIQRLSRDLARAGATMSEDEARFLVDGYYIIQETRKRTNNQVRAMKAEPHTLIVWLGEQSETLEGQIRRALEAYSSAHDVGQWMTSIYGIGPVISAGLLAHIQIDEAPTVGHIWRYAGLDPTSVWGKGEKRPWNASLKTLCWKIGQSFMKFSNQEECVYGALYRRRKEEEVLRNDTGGNFERARADFENNRYKKTTDAYKAVKDGKLPDAQVDARARRAVVKLFLSHLHTVWWFHQHHELPASPYAIAHLGHAHFIPIPNTDQIAGLTAALQKKGWC